MRAVEGRRGFLRNLVSLPLIGGGVTLIGNPTRAAEPITEQLLENYNTWLFYERRYLQLERFGPGMGPHGNHTDDAVTISTVKGRFDDVRMDFVRMGNDAARFHLGPSSASARAAVVLSAVGCDWRTS